MSLQAALGVYGLAITGACEPEPGEVAPAIRQIVLIGADGGAMWEIFSKSAEANDGALHPLDRWSSRVISAVADSFEATAFFPFGGPPWHPFIAWAARGEGARGSPIVMQVSPKRGLWMSYRGALGLSEPVGFQPEGGNPCLDCPAPCSTACPVGAFSGGRYDVPACLRHVTSEKGAACRSGCAARHACPVGTPPPLAQRRFHMSAFIAANGDQTD